MTTLFNYDPYYDDFDEDKNFMRVLFRPGYSVQARELTQLQTILSNQIEKFGNHIFKSGSPIIGGKVSLDRKANYILLQSQYGGTDIDASQFLNKTIVSFGSGKNVRAKVIAIDTTDTTSPALIIKYLSGDRFAESEDVRVYGEDIFATLKATNATGGSLVASIQEGVYYFKGQFVKVVPQFLLIELFYRIGNTSTVNIKPSYKIGIEFDENIVDEIDDTSLLDPAQGSFNYQAPGANRFKIATNLSKRTIDSSDVSTFFEIIRLVDDVIIREIDYPIYSEIEKTLARRTYDESGNYTVDPFVISLEEGDSANGKFNVILDPGKAYVGGYEFQTVGPTTISVDRAREVSNVNDYDLPTNYDSSVVLANVRGTLDISTYPQLDIHCVPHQNISISTGPAYNSTKIGTVYAHMIRYNDSTNAANGNSHTFTTYVFGANSSPITGTLGASGSSATTIAIPAAFNSSLSTNAYANMYFRITDAGGSAFAPILITSSNTSTLNLESSLPFIPSSNTFSIESDFTVAESLVANGGLFIAFAGNIDADSKSTTTGFASINEPRTASLLFNTPQTAIKANTISNMDFYARKKYSGTTSGGKFTVTSSGTDTFAFSSGSGTISDALLQDNIICFVRSDSASNVQFGITPNTVIALSNNNFTVTSVSTSSFEVDLKTTETVKVDLLVTTKINNAEDGATGVTKRKQLIPITSGTNLHSLIPYEMDTTGTQGTTVLYSANTSGETVSFSGGMVFKSIGATNFTNSSTLTDLRTPGRPVSLQVPDVYEIVGIFDSKSSGANVTSTMLTNSVYNVTERYEFDNGQRKTHYDHATIKLKRGFSAPTGRIFVQYRYLKSLSVFSGLFTIDSYAQGSNIDYDGVPSFNDRENNNVLSLRSAFDFRPYKTIAGTSLSGGLNPEPLQNIELSYDYFLPRIDKVIVKAGGQFSIVKGQAAIQPVPPTIDTKDMLIYTLTIPAYTESVKEIRADFKNNRRYTMEDIQSFEDRIRGLEYYISLNSLEKNAADAKILDNNGLERAKYGILVDNFTNKELSQDVFKIDNRNVLDKGTLYPASLMRQVKLNANNALQTGSTKLVGAGTKKAYMLSHTSASFAQQQYYTRAIPITQALFANFKGTTKLFPEFTGDVDTGVTAKVTLNSTQSIENAFNFVNGALKYIADNTPQWANDKDSPFAQVIDSKWYQTRSETVVGEAGWQAQGFGFITTTNEITSISAGAELQQKQISTSSSQVDVGTFVTDLAIQPYMKPRKIVFSSVGLRPSTRMYSFFDNEDVNNYIVVPNRVTLNVNTTLVNGEDVLIANTYADLLANVASLLTGGTSYKTGTVVMSETGSANVSIINENSSINLTSNFIYGIDSGGVYSISSVNDHRSGVTRGITSTTITLAPDAPSYDISGNTLYLIRKTSDEIGIGAAFAITGYDTSTKVATISGAGSYAGQQYVYSFGNNKSNKLGQIGGAFYIPSATFRSGQRNFRVTESFNNSYDADAVSFADKIYTSSGITLNKTTLVDTVLNVDIDSKIVGKTTSAKITGTREVSRAFTAIELPAAVDIVGGGAGGDGGGGGDDPLAQTFFVDSSRYPYGLFLESIDLFFRAKDDDNIPVVVQIRPTVNGSPSSDYWYPESVVVKYPSEINVSENPSLSTSSTVTNFKFDFPVYLKPGLYAFVVLTSSNEYTVWEAEKGSTTVNNEFVDKQPYLGTLYKSQNAMEYTPFMNEDLMFKLNRCVFPTTPATFYFENEATPSLYYVDKFKMMETSIVPSVGVTSLNYSLVSTTSLGVKETVYKPIVPYATYSLAFDETYAVGFRRKRIGNKNDWTVKAVMSTISDAVSPIISGESLHLNVWENFLDNAEINSDDFTIITPGSGYSNANLITVTSSTGVGANANVTVDANGNVVGIYVTSSGSGYMDDFDISYYTHPTTPATIVLNSEFDSSGGPCLARYITKPIKLADGYEAGDLRVFLSANKPGVSEVSVFYKVLSDSDATEFEDRPYQKMICINPTTTSSQDLSTYREYEYRPSATVNQVTYTGTNGVTYDTFKTFAIKIVLTSSDPAIPPSVRDLRIIATPAE
jgi:hypothetical protein